ncbi:hypothetical protein, partial [Bosea massiliensis]
AGGRSLIGMVAGELSESRPVNYRNDGRSESESAKGHWPAYASIFGVEVKSGVGGAFRSFDWNGARVVFCPHFVSRSFNSNASVAQFAKYALGDGWR